MFHQNEFIIVTFLILFIGLINGCGQKSADLVLMNGKIVTVDESNPEAQALAVRGGKILAVGDNEEIQAYITPSTNVIDLNGKLAIPGFIDSHGHFTSLGYSKMKLILMNVKNWNEIVDMVREAVQKKQPGEWILGRGWHQEKWNKTPKPNVDGLPFHHRLSKISPNNPVLLTHASGHSCIANARTMELAGITKETPNPEGGEIVKDAKGNPIGIFRETAQDPLEEALDAYSADRTPEQIETERQKVIELADQECLFISGVFT